MDEKSKKRAVELIARMNDARRRMVHAHGDALTYRTDSITGKRRYATYERQFDRYMKAQNELLSLLGAEPIHENIDGWEVE